MTDRPLTLELIEKRQDAIAQRLALVREAISRITESVDTILKQAISREGQRWD